MSAKRYLAIETSSPRLSLAVGDESRILAHYTGGQDWRHAETLFKGIEKLLRRVKWPLRSLTGVAVSTGPGSFTGIRIGLACARALGQSLKIPVVGVSSLEVMAAGAPEKAVWLAPQIDALRGQVFAALFKREKTGKLSRIFTEAMVEPAPWLQKCQTLLRPKGARHFWISPPKGCYPEAKVLLGLARPKLFKASPKSYLSVLPFYIRKASAEERRK